MFDMVKPERMFNILYIILLKNNRVQYEENEKKKTAIKLEKKNMVKPEQMPALFCFPLCYLCIMPL